MFVTLKPRKDWMASILKQVISPYCHHDGINHIYDLFTYLHITLKASDFITEEEIKHILNSLAEHRQSE